MNKVKAVLYDLGDIFFEAHLWRKWMYSEFSKMNLVKGTFAEFYFDYDAYLQNLYTMVDDYEAVYVSYLKKIGVANIHEFMDKSLKQKKYFEINRELYPEVKDTLNVIKSMGIKNVVLSDNEQVEADLRKNVITKFEINDLLDKVITSKDVGFCKPSQEIFYYALNYYSLNKDEVLFVAHDIDEIHGANQFGITTVEFNNYLNINTEANFKIKTFSELIDLIN